jgi:hypothetical protein
MELRMAGWVYGDFKQGQEDVLKDLIEALNDALVPA